LLSYRRIGSLCFNLCVRLGIGPIRRTLLHCHVVPPRFRDHHAAHAAGKSSAKGRSALRAGHTF
jgi:hypothetical protein